MEENGASNGAGRRRYWMIKQEPTTYSWSELMHEGRTDWTGVRNHQARNNLRKMKRGDRALFYHSGNEKAVVGIARIVKAAYPDPTAKEGDWVAVDIGPVRTLKTPVPLTTMRYDEKLSDLALLRQNQLSVLPLSRDEYSRIITLSAAKQRTKSESSPK